MFRLLGLALCITVAGCFSSSTANPGGGTTHDGGAELSPDAVAGLDANGDGGGSDRQREAGGADATEGGGVAFSVLLPDVTMTSPTIPMRLWSGVFRFTLTGDGAPLVSATGIDKSALADPVAVTFRASSSEVLVSNRHGNNAGDGVAGSISRFIYNRTDGTLTSNGTIVGSGLNSPEQIAFDPVSGEMFVANYDNPSGTGPAILRFTFDGSGNAAPNGTIGDGATQGLLITPDGKRLFATSGGYTSSIVRQYDIASGALSTAATIASAPRLSFMALRNNEVYVAAVDVNLVYRLTLDSSGNLTLKDSIPSHGAESIAFSPDGAEMFVGGDLTAELNRFQYRAQDDSWMATTTFANTFWSGGIAIVP